MAQKLIYFDGSTKHADLLSDDPSIWQQLGGIAKTDDITLYSRVAAAYRAYHLKANTVKSIPFTLNKVGSGEIFDNSATWENKVKFLPNPGELLRLNTLSCIATNTVYMLRSSNALGERTKRLVHAVPYYFRPQLSANWTTVDYIERSIGAVPERYEYPEDKRLVRMWRLDHTTELLPSPNTEALAIMNAAGVVYYADSWIKHFFERGGVAPIVIAMKGAVAPDKRKDEEKSWTNWLLGLGPRFRSSIARVFNADTLTVEKIGSSVMEMKDNETYRQAIENIAMGTGMPLSLLLANSANYATAKEEKATWIDNEIKPFCDWLADEYNRQVWNPLGFYMEFHPETMDPQQEDETERAGAMSTYMVVIGKYPTFDVFIGMAETLGLELSDSLIKAVEKHYADRAAEAERMRQQTQAKPVEVQPGKEEPEEQEPEAEEEEPAPAKSIKANETSAMIALRIPDPIREEIRARYAFVDEETLNELHITLVYLGDNRTIDKLAVVRAVSDLGMYQAPIKGALQGLARFVNGTELDPLVVTFDSPQAPALYGTLCGCLDNYHVPYHKEHGFIPHMTLAYIPAEAEMPIDTIEPIEINFSEVYYVDGNVWYSVPLAGYENKTKAEAPAKWTPSLEDMERLSRWREICNRRLKRGDSLDFAYVRENELPAEIVTTVKAKLAAAKTFDDITAAFEIDMPAVTPAPVQPQPSEDLKALADGLNRLAEVEWQKMQTKAEPPAPAQMPNVNITMPAISLTAQMPEQGSVIVNVPEQPAPVVNVAPPSVSVTNEVQPAPVEVKNEVTVKPAPVKVVQDGGKRVATVERDAHGRVTKITADDAE